MIIPKSAHKLPALMTDIFEVKTATTQDVPLIFSFIKELAEYEKLLHEVVVTEDNLKETLFGDDEWTVYRVTDQALDDLASSWTNRTIN